MVLEAKLKDTSPPQTSVQEGDLSEAVKSEAALSTKGKDLSSVRAETDKAQSEKGVEV